MTVDRRRACACVLGGMALVLQRTRAQERSKAFRIGTISTSTPELGAFYFTALVDTLRDLGWKPDVDIVFERRFSMGDSSRLEAFAAEHAHAGVDLILVTYDSTALIARRATATIPIVLIDGTDPVGRGLAASLARPGGNVTGVAWTSVGSTLFAKPLQFLREVRPSLTRVAALRLASPAFVPIDAEARDAARSIGVVLEPVDLSPATGDLDAPFAAIRKMRAEALLFWPVGVANDWHARVARRTLDERLPSASQHLWYPREGGLLACGPPPGESFRRAAVYIDKILRGARPGDLPIEQPTRLDLVVNRRTAARLGVEMPTSLLLRADEVIE